MKYLFISCMFALVSCFKPNHPTFQSIYPLEPNSTYVDLLDSNGKFESRQVTDYYIVYGSVEDKEYLYGLFKEFAASHFDLTQVRLPIKYEIRFYKISGAVTNNSAAYEKNQVNYKTEDCIASVFYSQDGHHQVVFNDQSRP
jgi:hypothetical protein